MKKVILFAIIIVILITIAFKYQNSSSKDIKTSRENSSKILNNEIKKKSIIKEEKNIELNDTNNQIDEIKLLVKKAEHLLENTKDEEALLMYDLILEKISLSNDPLLDEYFVTTCMSKAYIYQVYPNIDSDAAIEAYNQIIKKFEESNDSKSIQYYIDAKIQRSYLLPEDEKMESYNELIAKFENSNDIDTLKKVESLLIAKSFQLMGNNDEEAMQILDKVLEKYQEKNASIRLPENIQFSILNNIELALITNNENDDYVELAKKFMSNSPDTKPLLDMLEILKNAQDLDQEEALATWKKEHGDYHFPDWSFQEVERWAYKIEDQETKDRVSKYVNAFVNQKYNMPDQYSNNHINDNQNSDEEIIENEIITEEIYEEERDLVENNESKEEIYPNPYENSDELQYEPDPYVQEVYEATGEYLETYE
jgi:hypothetical protein